jgi:hypothetical protein
MGLQIPPRQRFFCSLPCPLLQGIASGLGSRVCGLHVAGSCPSLAHAHRYAAPPDVAIAPDTLTRQNSRYRASPQAVYTGCWMQTSEKGPSRTSMNKELLVCLLVLRTPLGSQPQRDVRRLHRLLYHTD